MFKNLFLVFALLFSITANAYVPGANDAYQLCKNQSGNFGVTIPGSAQAVGPSGLPLYRTLVSNPTGGGIGNTFQGFYDASTLDGTQFHTDGTHQFNVMCICHFAYIPNANTYFQGQFGTATASFTSGTTSAPTGAVYQGGAINITMFPFMDNSSTTEDPLTCKLLPMIIPISKYPFWNQVTAQSQLAIFLVGTLKP